jgi:hypothetical protein
LKYLYCAGIKTEASQFNTNPVTTLPFPTSYPTTHPGLQYYSLPTIPFPFVGQRAAAPQQKPFNPQNIPIKREPLTPQKLPTKQETFSGQNPYETANVMTNFSSDARTNFSPKYSPAQVF